jgi:CxxC-x17-CxxC domain-containing protein
MATRTPVRRARRRKPPSSLSEGRFRVDADRTISCLDCGTDFVFTSGEQEFYAQRGFTELPKRCVNCRARRKAQRQGDGYRANGGGYDSGFGAGFNGGLRSEYGNASSVSAYAGYAGGYPGSAPHLRERPQREMFDAVCAECGGTARVPFRPSGARPVYCSNCFQSRR